MTMRLAKGFAIFSIAGLLSVTAGAAHANSYDASSGYTPSGDTNQNLNVSTNNNSHSTSNAQGNLNQAGSLVNTQVNNYALGRSIVGNGIADCSSDGLAVSAYGAGNGSFDSGSFGGTFTYTHSFGMSNCKAYAKTQLGRAKLETCLVLISNYAQMTKAGVEVDYQKLQKLTNIECPTVSLNPRPAVQVETNSSYTVPPANTGGGNLPPKPLVRGLW
jgi:hypothetical protein